MDVRGIPSLGARKVEANHAEIGAYLIGLWGLSDPIVEAICYHADPGPCVDDGFSTVTLVHVASALAREDSTEETLEDPDGISLDYLKALGLDERLPVWREVCHAVLEKEAHA